MHNTNPNITQKSNLMTKDTGLPPYSANLRLLTKQNTTFRTTLWTGPHLQLTVMCIPIREEIGLEQHPHIDQFLYIEQGYGILKTGSSKDQLHTQQNVSAGHTIIIPAGAWHNLINTGNIPLKLYSVYAPPQHPHGTIHRTKADDRH